MQISEIVRSAILLTVGLILIFMFYYMLGGYALLDNNEGLYAQIPLEMYITGDLVIPTLNGNPYIEKPPFLYWLILMVYKVFGISEWTSRLVPATAGLLICLSTGYFARITRYTETSWLCPLMLGTSLGFIIFSRMVFFDVLLTLFFTFSMFCFYIWYEKDRQIWLHLSYVSLALAILTKGLLALALGFLIVAVFFILDRTKFQKIIKFLNPISLILFLLIVVPWHVLASNQEEGFAWFYFINEHVLRFLDLKEPRDYYHGPIYYYIPRIIGYVFPWSLFLVFLFKRSSVKGMPKLNKFLWIWFLAILAFFSISQAKANYYIVLGLPPLMMALAMRIEDLIDQKKSRLLRILTSITVVVITIALGGFYYLDIDPRLEPYKSLLSQEMVIVWCAYAAIGITVIWALARHVYLTPLFLGSLMVLVAYIALEAAEQVQDTFSVKYLVGDIPKEYRRTPKSVYLYHNYEDHYSTAPYYARRPLPVVESFSRDLLYGQKHPRRPQYFVSMPQFHERLKKQTIFVITRDKYIKELKDKGLCLKSHRGKRSLMSNKCS